MYRQILWGLVLTLGIFMSSCSLDKDANVVDPPVSKSVTPNTPSPKNGAIDREPYQLLTWECLGVSNYSVYFGKEVSSLSLIKSNIKEKYADVIATKKGEIYYWKVVSHFSDGTEKEGPVWHFITKHSSSSTVAPGYVITKHSFATVKPNKIKMLFQVLDLDGKGVDFLTVDDFEILEDGEYVSLTESNLRITKRQNNNDSYKLKTVLMLDNSTSITDDPTHLSNMELLKSAAKSFVDNMSDQQEVALFKFSSSAEKIVNFTSDKNKLKNVIDNIGRGNVSTNLYGAIIDGVAEWNDFSDLTKTVQGQLVLFTDGDNTQGGHTLGEALDAVGEKNIYTVGLGSEIEPEVLKQIGNSGAFTIADMSQLNQVFIQIQLEINAYANGVYWMEYTSPKRENSEHTLHLSIKNNPLAGAIIDGTFNSTGFFDPSNGIYLNSSFSNPDGSSEYLLVAGGDPVTINAVTYGGTDKPSYRWGLDSSLDIIKKDSPVNSEVEISAKSSAPAGNVQIAVTDLKNGFSKTITFTIRR